MRFLILLFLVSVSRADIMPQPFQRVALSPDSEYVARVALGRWIEAEKRSLPDWVSIHRFDHEKREYLKVSEFQYGDKIGSGFLFVANGGKHVLGVNIGHLDRFRTARHEALRRFGHTPEVLAGD